MAAEAVPLSVAFDGNLRIAFVPSGSSAKSVAILAGSSTKDLTYSLKKFDSQITEETVEDPRLTLKQKLTQPGKSSQTLEVQYVFGDDSDTAASTLVEGTQGSIVARYSIDNATAWTTGQKVDIITVRCGKQRKDAPVENGVQTITQTLFVTGVTQDDVVLVA